jgi:hypothetical protein
MAAKTLSPIRLTGIGAFAMPAAPAVAGIGAVCSAERLGGESAVARLHQRPVVGGSDMQIRYLARELDLLGAADRDAWFGQDNSEQAGGNDPGP